MVGTDIKAGDYISANKVINNLGGQQFKNFTQLLYNSAYLGFNSKINIANDGNPNLKNIKYDIFNTDTMTKTNMEYNSTDKYYFYNPSADELDTYDEFNDNSVNYTLWEKDVWVDNPGVTEENSQYIQFNSGTSFNGGGTLRAINANLIDYPIWRIKYLNRTSTSLTGLIQISDGINRITVTTTTIDNTEVFIWYDSVNSKALFSTSAGNLSSVSTASITGTPSISFGFSGTSGATPYYLRFDFARCSISNSLPVGSIISSSTITDENIKDCIATINENNSFISSVSSDGINYEEVTDATIHRFTNIGTDLKFKAEINEYRAGDIPKISEYAIWYNIGAN